MPASTITVNEIRRRLDVSDRRFFPGGTLAVAAGDYTNGTGLVLDLAGLHAGKGLIERVEAWSETSGYTYRVVIGGTNATHHLRIFSGATELSSAATPAGVVADTIYFRATRFKG